MDWTFDLIGKHIHVNDTVIYPAHPKNSRTMCLKKGVVRSVSPLGGITVHKENKDGFIYVRMNNFVKVEE